MQSLASSHHLILITLKSASCPICPQLLKILNVYGLDPDTNNFTDPFTLQKLEMDSVRKRVNNTNIRQVSDINSNYSSFVFF